jgi:hypothetical protein
VPTSQEAGGHVAANWLLAILQVEAMGAWMTVEEASWRDVGDTDCLLHRAWVELPNWLAVAGRKHRSGHGPGDQNQTKCWHGSK